MRRASSPNKRKPARPRADVPLAVRVFLGILRAKGLPLPEQEHRFALPSREWRFDFAWPAQLIALEVEGGIWKKGGGAHSHPVNIMRDLDKYNRAALLGWRVLRVTPQQLRGPITLLMLQRALDPARFLDLEPLLEIVDRGRRLKQAQL